MEFVNRMISKQQVTLEQYNKLENLMIRHGISKKIRFYILKDVEIIREKAKSELEQPDSH